MDRPVTCSTALVGYGTLLSRSSRALTVGEIAVDGMDPVPVVVPGYRRLANVRAPHYEPSYRVSDEPIEVSAFNVEPHPGGSLNGLIVELDESALEAMDEREEVYERVRVSVEEFGTGRPLGGAFVYSAPDSSRWVERDPQTLLPRWRDVVTSRNAAYRVSSAFGRTFDETTYLADGETLLARHYDGLLPEIDADADGRQSWSR